MHSRSARMACVPHPSLLSVIEAQIFFLVGGTNPLTLVAKKTLFFDPQLRSMQEGRMRREPNKKSIPLSSVHHYRCHAHIRFSHFATDFTHFPRFFHFTHAIHFAPFKRSTLSLIQMSRLVVRIILFGLQFTRSAPFAHFNHCIHFTHVSVISFISLLSLDSDECRVPDRMQVTKQHIDCGMQLPIVLPRVYCSLHFFTPAALFVVIAFSRVSHFVLSLHSLLLYDSLFLLCWRILLCVARP